MFAIGDIICQLDWEHGFEVGVVRRVIGCSSFGIDLIERNGEHIDEHIEIDEYAAKSSWEKCVITFRCPDCGRVRHGNKKHQCQLLSDSE